MTTHNNPGTQYSAISQLKESETGPRHLRVTSYSPLTIWSVDDEWFEGHMGSSNQTTGIIPALFGTSPPEVASFGEIAQKLRSSTGSNVILSPNDVKTMKDLVKFCRKQTFSVDLCFCNFQYFSKNFSLLDSPFNLLLVDINYTNMRDPECFGVKLVAELLKGRRPTAEIAFLTGRDKRPIEYARDRLTGDPSWWPVVKLQTILKDSDENTRKHRTR